MSLLKKHINIKYFPLAELILNSIDVLPFVSIIGGSGFAANMKYNVLKEFDISVFTNEAESSVVGHSRKIQIAEVSGKRVLVFGGRRHLYEGYSIGETLSSIFLSYMCGIKNIIITNSAGGLNPTYKVGDLMLINDVINFTGKRLHQYFTISAHINKMGNKRLFDDKYNQKLSDRLLEKGIATHKGTYIAVLGPNYETAAEARMFRTMKADAIGMSTVLEVQAADLLRMNVIACSLITNELSETYTPNLEHSHVIDIAKHKSDTINTLISEAVSTF